MTRLLAKPDSPLGLRVRPSRCVTPRRAEETDEKIETKLSLDNNQDTVRCWPLPLSRDARSP